MKTCPNCSCALVVTEPSAFLYCPNCETIYKDEAWGLVECEPEDYDLPDEPKDVPPQ